jgi:hypothetical protein
VFVNEIHVVVVKGGVAVLDTVFSIYIRANQLPEPQVGNGME